MQTAYDANDRITSVTDERDKIWTYSYDANGNLINNTDPSGNSTQYAYGTIQPLIDNTSILKSFFQQIFHF
ncbi:MAG: hypothetical protein GWP10_05625 [Nitrospiraceae bacterium]|nr:hypothetical protein [Nitrospiraceae bacterium]